MFREFGHNAIELSHFYRCSDQNWTKNLGINSLRLARNLVATSERIILWTGEQIGCLLQVPHYGRFGSDQWYTYVKCTEATPSWSVCALRGAPETFCKHTTKAKENNHGIYDIFPASLANSPKKSPKTNITCKQKSPLPSEWRNDSHMVLHDSTIQGAGIGVFAHAVPSVCNSQHYVYMFVYIIIIYIIIISMSKLHWWGLISPNRLVRPLSSLW